MSQPYRKRARDGEHTSDLDDDDSFEHSSILPSSPQPFCSEMDQHTGIDELDDDNGENLFGSNMESDYKENAEQDQYEEAGIDDEEYDALDMAARRVIDARLGHKDDAIERRQRSMAEAFMDSLDNDEDDVVIGPSSFAAYSRRIQRRIFSQDLIQKASDQAEMSIEDLANIKNATIGLWITKEGPRRAIKREFKDFLQTHVDEYGSSVYGKRIRDMGERNGASFEISFEHLVSAKAVLGYFLANSPVPMLNILDEVALEVTLMQYPEYERIHRDIHVRITDLPSTNSLRELRQNQLNCMIRVSGVVTRRTGVFPQLKWVKCNCDNCDQLLGPFYQDIHSEIKINNCPSCQSRGPFILNMEETIYRNYQKLTIQESPGTIPPGRLPRHREVICLSDLIDKAKPGEEIEVTGVYRNNFDASLSTKSGFPVFATIIEANHINKREDMFASYRLTDEDKKIIIGMGNDMQIGQKIIKSIAPSIYGHNGIKRAIALSLFGGVSKNVQDKHSIRGDINILMLGDPGTAKSQFLKYVEKTAQRAVFTTGQGASAVGLTASVRRDPVTSEWTLDGGALVLADRGVCLIDEFDKMNDGDRTSIHEAMEQQSISISKSGIIATLQARCSIIAAANPIRGRYISSIPFSQNVELTEPILSRFDVLCVVKDIVEPEQDHLLATNVIASHIRSHPKHGQEENDGDDDEYAKPSEDDPDIIPQDVLRKYLMYSREMIRPQLKEVDEHKLSSLYSELRRESLASGSIPITVRHLESMIRLAEANAKMHLREYVRSDDMDMAIRVALDSFISTQKYSMMKVLRQRFSKYIVQTHDVNELLLSLVNSITKVALRLYQVRHKTLPSLLEIEVADLETKASKLGIHNIQPFLHSQLFENQNYSLESSRGVIIKRY
ncbi:MCM2/3/5 family-domain-containing protein [Absidia repens]|uniref:DNA replication licensing factor MCM2 n=1 Tax=Absidia repens TaxID=90262 RepID=A0A1X2I4X6_9FUNG|nr:MCM2/3/5 family-domain-containing protein [Absidia repens]